MTDADLVRAVQGGDAVALETLYRRYVASVWRYAYGRLGGNADAAQDVTSETFVAAVREIRTVDPDRMFLARWLIGIARHKVGDHERQVARSVALSASAHGRATEQENDPRAPVEAAELRAEVRAVMDTMPDDERIVLEWKYLDGLSVREIAARLGRSDKAAETLLYRARRSFRKMFKRR